MKVERMVEIETNDIHVGDIISVGKYTATCTSVTSKAALFLLDQYITGHGCLWEAIQSEEVLSDFADIRKYMVPFEDGDMLKIPFGYSWRGCGDYSWARLRPIFLISLKKKDTMTQNTTKKSAPENEETIQDVLDTFNEKQRLVLCYLVGKAIKGAKKGKTLEEHAQEIYLMKNHTVPYTQGREEASREILEKVLDILGG